MIRGVYQGWTGWRNLGDEAMLEACRRAMPRLQWSARPPFDTRASGTWGRVGEACRRGAERLLPPRPALLGGGTLINRTPQWLDEYRHLRRVARRPVPVFSPGVANPAYWSRHPGWQDTRGEWREALADLPEVGVRGPVSKRLLDEAGVRNVRVTGDPALLFHRPAIDRTAARRIGLNAGRAGGRMWGDENALIATLTETARRLTARGFDVRLLPVWDRDIPVCADVARSAGLARDAVDPLVLDADAFVERLRHFDVVVTVKLHAAVLAAAAGVPFVAIEYRPKVRDFAESVGCSEVTLRSGDVDAARLVRRVEQQYDAVPVERARLSGRAGELAATFRDYAQRMEALLLQ